jgi:mono/diheme cytochrome c family protein
MKKVSRDHYGLVIEASDKNFDEVKVREYLKSLNPVSLEDIYFPEKETYSVLEPKFVTFLIVVALATSGVTYFALNKLLYMQPFTWMMEQPKLTPQKLSTFFTDGFGMRTPVQGTVARGFLPYPYKGQTNPTKENLKLGKEKFLTFCSPCHGNFGDGDSRLRGQFPNPPSLHSTRAREFSDGMIYHIITNGQNVMPSYASQITREERWAIVNYVRVLQRAKNAKSSDLQVVNKETGNNASN